MKTIHFHPQGGAKPVVGRELEGTEPEEERILQKGDVWSAPSGEWEEIPEAFLGNPVTPKEAQGKFRGRTAIIVRPSK